MIKDEVKKRGEARRFAVLGAGAFGAVLGKVLMENGHRVVFYDPIVAREKETLEFAENGGLVAAVKGDLDAALEGAEIVVLVAPSQVVEELLPQLPHDRPLVIATKGLLGDELFRDFEDYMVISGPGFAADIAAHRTTLLTITDERLRQWFGREYLTFDFTLDRKGVLMCGGLKNVYAILAGLLDLQPDTTEQENFLTEVGGEMRALLSANGADAVTAELACGKGDLKITCAEPSRNYEFGQILREDQKAKPAKTVEGLATLERIKTGAIEVPAAAYKLKDLMAQSENWASDAREED